MEFEEQFIKGVFIIDPTRIEDTRGEFVKTYHFEAFREIVGSLELREEFFSISNKYTLRGMHFQRPPSAHNKLVYCTFGRILDVLVDLRKYSPTYGKSFSIELSHSNRKMLWIPKGVAHGFLSLADGSCVVYKTDFEHVPHDDLGLHWNSFDFSWPGDREQFIISSRDQKHPMLSNFTSPFELP